ncbi:hypothetical protein [Beijerinckia indica]|nr:hypothetical protein [Beijerinckia indica]
MPVLTILPSPENKAGPLDGPFVLTTPDDDAELIAIVIAFVRLVIRGVSSYNKQGMEESSNLKSYAMECYEELQDESPEAAERLIDLMVDCSGMPDALKTHPIWRLDRAILRVLPGIVFEE